MGLLVLAALVAAHKHRENSYRRSHHSSYSSSYGSNHNSSYSSSSSNSSYRREPSSEEVLTALTLKNMSDTSSPLYNFFNNIIEECCITLDRSIASLEEEKKTLQEKAIERAKSYNELYEILKSEGIDFYFTNSSECVINGIELTYGLTYNEMVTNLKRCKEKKEKSIEEAKEEIEIEEKERTKENFLSKISILKSSRNCHKDKASQLEKSINKHIKEIDESVETIEAIDKFINVMADKQELYAKASKNYRTQCYENSSFYSCDYQIQSNKMRRADSDFYEEEIEETIERMKEEGKLTDEEIGNICELMDTLQSNSTETKQEGSQELSFERKRTLKDVVYYFITNEYYGYKAKKEKEARNEKASENQKVKK